MKNKDLRKAIVEDGTLTMYTSKRAELVQTGKLDLIEDPSTYGLIPELMKECENARISRKKQREKVEEHIRYLIDNQEELDVDLYFGTWTFSEISLNYRPETRKKAVTRLLGRTCEDFMTNIDFGAENEREHYHGIIAIPRGTYQITSKVYSKKYHCYLYNIDILDEYKKYGFYDLQEINCNDLSAELIAKYITKLTQHSIKVKQNYVSVKKGSSYQEEKHKQKRYPTIMEQEAQEEAMRIYKEYIA